MKEYNKKEIYLNFKKNYKWLGIIEYKTLLFLICYILGLVFLLNKLQLKLEYMIYFFMFLVIPVASILIFYTKDESLLDVFQTMTRFFISKKIFTNLNNITNLKNEKYIVKSKNSTYKKDIVKKVNR